MLETALILILVVAYIVHKRSQPTPPATQIIYMTPKQTTRTRQTPPPQSAKKSKFELAVLDKSNDEQFIKQCCKYRNILNQHFENNQSDLVCLSEPESPASESQLHYLSGLGYNNEKVSLTMAQASLLISSMADIEHSQRNQYWRNELEQMGADTSHAKTQMDLYLIEQRITKSVAKWFEYQYISSPDSIESMNSHFVKEGYVNFWGIDVNSHAGGSYKWVIINTIKSAPSNRQKAFKDYIEKQYEIGQAFRTKAKSKQFRMSWYVNAFARPDLEEFPTVNDAVDILIQMRKSKAKNKTAPQLTKYLRNSSPP